MTESVPDPDDSRLPETAEKLVARLVKASTPRKWQVRVLGIACAVLIGVIIVLVTWVIPAIRSDTSQNAQYTNSVVQHECAALDLITKTPVAYPADPAANPSRVASYRFYEAVLSWERSDHCP